MVDQELEFSKELFRSSTSRKGIRVLIPGYYVDYVLQIFILIIGKRKEREKVSLVARVYWEKTNNHERERVDVCSGDMIMNGNADKSADMVRVYGAVYIRR